MHCGCSLAHKGNALSRPWQPNLNGSVESCVGLPLIWECVKFVVWNVWNASLCGCYWQWEYTREVGIASVMLRFISLTGKGVSSLTLSCSLVVSFKGMAILGSSVSSTCLGLDFASCCGHCWLEGTFFMSFLCPSCTALLSSYRGLVIGVG